MNGLNRILSKIDSDTSAEIAKLTEAKSAEAAAERDKILAEAQAQADEITADAEKTAQRIKENSESGCAAHIKRCILAAKSDVIDSCIAHGTKQLKNMPDDEYFAAMEKLILKYAHSGETGELLLNRRDAERLPGGFIDGVNTRLAESGGSIKLSADRCDADGGFILRYGGIEENCTYDALVRDNMDEIRDRLYSQLKCQEAEA